MHTVYVPADRFVAQGGPDLPGRLGRRGHRGAGPPRTPRRRPRPGLRPGRRGGPGGLGRGRRQARDRADRGPARRPRGRLRDPVRRRGGRGRAGRRSGARRGGRRAGPARRSSGSGSSRWRARPDGAGCAASTSCSARCWPPATCPPGWVVTLPKVTSVDQVEAMVDVCGRLEAAYGLAEGRLRFEVQVETPQAILLADGTAGVARMVHAAAGRCTGLHFGTYDYSAALGISGGQQALDHPVADHAKAGHAARRRRDRRAGQRRFDERRPGRRRARRARRLGPARPPGPTVPGTRPLPGLGPAPRPAADAVRGHVPVLPRRARAAPATGSAPTWPATRAACSTSRPPRRRWPRSCCAACTAARWAPRRSPTSPAPTSPPSPRWRPAGWAGLLRTEERAGVSPGGRRAGRGRSPGR